MTQRTAILQHLQRGRAITPSQALSRFGTMRLAARILELRRQHRIVTTMIHVGRGKHVAAYRLA